jgi:hypothetical protein
MDDRKGYPKTPALGSARRKKGAMLKNRRPRIAPRPKNALFLWGLLFYERYFLRLAQWCSVPWKRQGGYSARTVLVGNASCNCPGNKRGHRAGRRNLP